MERRPARRQRLYSASLRCASLKPTGSTAEAEFEERLRRKLQGEDATQPRTYSASANQGAREKTARESKHRASLPPKQIARRQSSGEHKPSKKNMKSTALYNSFTLGGTSSVAVPDFEERLRRKKEEKARHKSCKEPKIDEEKKLHRPSEAVTGKFDSNTGGTSKNKKDLSDDERALPYETSVCFEGVLSIVADLQQFKEENGHLQIPVSHPTFMDIMDTFSSVGMEQMLNRRWDYQFSDLKAFARDHGDCLVPVTHPTLGKWARTQCNPFQQFKQRLASPFTKHRYSKLFSVGFDEFVEWEEMNKENAHPKKKEEVSKKADVDPAEVRAIEEAKPNREAPQAQMRRKSMHLWKGLSLTLSKRTLTNAPAEDDGSANVELDRSLDDGFKIEERGSADAIDTYRVSPGEDAVATREQLALGVTVAAAAGKIRKKRHKKGRNAGAREVARPDKDTIRAEMRDKSQHLRKMTSSRAMQSRMLTSSITDCEGDGGTEGDEAMALQRNSSLRRSASSLSLGEGDSVLSGSNLMSRKEPLRSIYAMSQDDISFRADNWSESGGPRGNSGNDVSWSDLRAVLDSTAKQSTITERNAFPSNSDSVEDE